MARILVVDDDSELRTTMVEILQALPVEIQDVADAEAALVLMAGGRFDLVLLDLALPGLQGDAALPHLRRLAPLTTIIMVTAQGTIDSAVHCMRLGASDYLTKPFSRVQLLDTVQRALDSSAFRHCEEIVAMDGVFQGLSNAYRRHILALLGEEGPTRFMDIVRHLALEDHTKANFHVRVLRESGLIEQTDQRAYRLTESGRKILACLTSLPPASPSGKN